MRAPPTLFSSRDMIAFPACRMCSWPSGLAPSDVRSTPVIENSEPNFRKGSKAEIQTLRRYRPPRRGTGGGSKARERRCNWRCLGIFASPQDAEDASDADSQLFRRFSSGLASVNQSEDLFSFGASCGDAAAIFAATVSSRDLPCFLSAATFSRIATSMSRNSLSSPVLLTVSVAKAKSGRIGDEVRRGLRVI